MSLESSLEGRGKAGVEGLGGKWVTANPMQVMVILLEATQSRKDWPSEAQLHSLIPL